MIQPTRYPRRPMVKKPLPQAPAQEWYCCRCGQKFFKIRPGAVVKGVQIKCKRCKEIINIEIEP